MREVTVKGESTVGEGDAARKVTYDGVVRLPESIQEYKQFVQAEGLLQPLRDENGKLTGKSETHEQAVVRAIADYEMRRQRAALRPSKTKATGARKFQGAISQALKSGVSAEDIEKALASIGARVEG